MSIKKSRDGVTLYIDNNWPDTCVGIDIEDDVEEIYFDSVCVYRLQTINKSFPNVKSIHIGCDVVTIEISNYMFPNVRDVKSASARFLSGKTLCSTGGLLLNSFCLRNDEILDLTNVICIKDYALEGCKAMKVSNDSRVISVEPNATAGSLMKLPYINNCFQVIGRVIVGFNPDADKIVLPNKNVVNIMDGLKFPKDKTIVFYNFKELVALYSRYGYSGFVFHSVELWDESVDERQLSAFMFEANNIYSIKLNHHKTLSVIDNILYNKTDKRLVQALASKTGSVLVQDGTEIIGEDAFFSSKIESITFPDSLTEIHSNAFGYCENLESINFGNGIKRIGDECNGNLFKSCINLTSVDIPEQVVEIGRGAFMDCRNLSELKLHEGIREIDRFAFAGCDSLKKVELPASVENLGFHSFYHTDELIINPNSEHIPSGLYKSIFTDTCCFNENLKTVIIRWREHVNYLPKQMVNNITGMEIEEWLKEDKSFYMYAVHSFNKKQTALLEYINKSSDTSKAYLRRVGKQFAKELLDSNNQDGFIEFIKLGLVSKAGLTELLKITRERGLISESSYILDAINQSTKRNTFNL